jgi:exodeoxyribonuclease VII large subunit
MAAPGNRDVLSVSDFTKNVRRLIEGEFPLLYIEGEVSNFAAPRSGHWYFTLKDQHAQIRCVMFRNRNQLIRFKVTDGQQIVTRARASLYEARGEFQVIVEFMEEAGDGALRRAFDALRTRLQTEGLFDDALKKPIPRVPRHVGILTSASGAAITDVLHVFERRFPAMRRTLLPVQVQGDDAVRQIVTAIDFANRFAREPFDVLLLTRGGGSLEDLWSFNVEAVARAIAESAIPVVCGVGHESDVTIADFVADLRGATPSAAAELITPDQAAFHAQLRALEDRLAQQVQRHIDVKRARISEYAGRLTHPGNRLANLRRELRTHSTRLGLAMRTALEGARQKTAIAKQRLTDPRGRLVVHEQNLAHIDQRLRGAASAHVAQHRARFDTAVQRLNTLSPLNTLTRGYAIVTRGTSTTDVITSHSQVVPGETITARLADGQLEAAITRATPRQPSPDQPDDPDTSLPASADKIDDSTTNNPSTRNPDA